MCRCTVIHSGKRLPLLLPLLAMPREGVGGDIGPHTHTHTHTTLNCTSNSYTSLNIAMQAETKCMFRNTQACMQCTHTSAHMLKHIDTHQHMLKHKHAHMCSNTVGWFSASSLTPAIFWRLSWTQGWAWQHICTSCDNCIFAQTAGNCTDILHN